MEKRGLPRTDIPLLNNAGIESAIGHSPRQTLASRPVKAGDDLRMIHLDIRQSLNRNDILPMEEFRPGDHREFSKIDFRGRDPLLDTSECRMGEALPFTLN